MKKIIFILITLLYSYNIFSQDYNNEDINFFSKRGEETKTSVYVSIDFAYQLLNDINLNNDNSDNTNLSITVGARIGILLNNQIVIGVYGFTNTKNMYNISLDRYLRYGGGGILLEPRLFPKLPIHISIPLRAGFGTISYHKNNNWATTKPPNEFNDTYLIFEPGIEIELNIVKYFKIAVGINYKITDGIIMEETPIDILDSSIDILDSWSVNISFKILYPN